jgi:amino acid transporter
MRAIQKGPPLISRSEAPRKLRRSLGLIDLTAIGLNATVGSGIFLLPDDLFRAMGFWSPLAFLLCGLCLLPVAWCYAEAARGTDATGGPYVYARDAFGPTAGFLVGWMCLGNSLFSFAAAASASAAYAQRLAPWISPGVGTRLFAVGVIAVFAALNYFGARPGALAIRVFTFGKFAVLLLLVSALLPGLDFSAVTAQSSLPSTDGVASATFLALFALQGFEVVPVPAGEAQAPARRVPVAVLLTVISTACLYVVIQFVLEFGFDDLGKVGDAPLSEAALAVSPSLGLVVAAGALVSTLGFVSGSALGTPRYLFAMASHGGLPRLLDRLHPKYQSPHVAVLVTCALSALLVIPFDYRTLIGISNVAVAVQYGSTCLAVLRRSIAGRNLASSWKRLGLSVAGVSVSLAICTVATWQELAWAAGTLLFGLAVRKLTSLTKTGDESIGL